MAQTESEPESLSCDTFVYGSTPGGIAAAVEAARRGERVVLACPKNNPGGMTASGLCTTDAVRRHLFGAFVLEFIGEVRKRYLEILGTGHPDWPLCHDGWHYEPSVAEECFRTIIERQENLEWRPGWWVTDAKVEDGRIQSVELQSCGGKTGTAPSHSRTRSLGTVPILHVTARTFIDATYEGDLAARAGVPSRVGREGCDEFGESFAGIRYIDWRNGQEIQTPQSGEPSIGIQAYCARSIITDDADHRIPIDKPDTYEQHLQDYLPLLDDFRTQRVTNLGQILAKCPMPRKKVEINGNIRVLTSLNCPGVSWAYPEAGRHMRQTLDRFHIEHAAGLIYFLQHDPHVPEDIAAEARRFGLHDDEFVDNGHWPWQIYVRQARRIQGRAIVTQHNFMVDPKTGRTPTAPDPIAFGEYSFDVHPCHDRRWAVDGVMEGVLSRLGRDKANGPAQPGQVPYGAMLPMKIDNLLVPVALSCTHIAMSVLRMEPVWMTTGQVAGLAAATAHEQHIDVADIDPAPLPGKLGILIDPSARTVG